MRAGNTDNFVFITSGTSSENSLLLLLFVFGYEDGLTTGFDFFCFFCGVDVMIPDRLGLLLAIVFSCNMAERNDSVTYSINREIVMDTENGSRRVSR